MTHLAGCKGVEKGQMGEEDGSFRHHQLEEVGALAVWRGGVVEVSVWVEWVTVIHGPMSVCPSVRHKSVFY